MTNDQADTLIMVLLGISNTLEEIADAIREK